VGEPITMCWRALKACWLALCPLLLCRLQLCVCVCVCVLADVLAIRCLARQRGRTQATQPLGLCLCIHEHQVVRTGDGLFRAASVCVCGGVRACVRARARAC
jgi:hypothetical protein